MKRFMGEVFSKSLRIRFQSHPYFSVSKLIPNFGVNRNQLGDSMNKEGQTLKLGQSSSDNLAKFLNRSIYLICIFKT
jgi:hypothetical protein